MEKQCNIVSTTQKYKSLLPTCLKNKTKRRPKRNEITSVLGHLTPQGTKQFHRRPKTQKLQKYPQRFRTPQKVSLETKNSSNKSSEKTSLKQTQQTNQTTTPTSPPDQPENQTKQTNMTHQTNQTHQTYQTNQTHQTSQAYITKDAVHQFSK